MQAIFFYTVFFTLHGLINFYIFIHGWHAIPAVRSIKIIYSTVYVTVFLLSAFEMLLYHFPYSLHVKVAHWAGSLWYGYMTYLFILLLLIDIMRIIVYLLRIEIPVIINNYQLLKMVLFLIVLTVVSGVMFKGYSNARDLKVTRLTLKIDKNAGRLKSLNIVMISDIHINRIIDGKRILMIAETIRTLHPDIILIPGDIVDSYIGPFVEDNICEIFKGMEAAYGIYATTGNHEYYGDIKKTIPVLESCGIKMLRDKTVKIDDSFYITGREDPTGEKYYNARPRSGISELLNKTDPGLPVILMDHTPSDLSSAYEAGVDLQISGHTHAGQLYPYNLIVNKIYEKAWGYIRKGNTHYYISCGVGSWGPPVRIGSYSEIVNIRLEFRGNQNLKS